MKAIPFNTKGRYHIYHSEGGESFIKLLTRANVFFITGNSILLIMEVVSPFFGYWHGVSMLATVLASLTSARVLHHYSNRMVHNMWLLKDGNMVEVEFFSAFLMPKTDKFQIKNFGYLQPSRLYNVDTFTY